MARVAKQLPTPNLTIKGQRVKEGVTVADPREGRGGEQAPFPLPLIFRPEGPEKCFSDSAPPPLNPYLRVWMTGTPAPLSQGLDPAMRKGWVASPSNFI